MEELFNKVTREVSTKVEEGLTKATAYLKDHDVPVDEMKEEFSKRAEKPVEDLKGFIDQIKDKPIEDIRQDVSHKISDVIGEKSREEMKKAKEKVLPTMSGPTLSLRRKNKDLIRVPAVLGVGMVLYGLTKPKHFLLAATALILTKTDVAYTDEDRDITVSEYLSSSSKTAYEKVVETKDSVEFRITDLKEFGIDTRPSSQKYYTIKL